MSEMFAALPRPRFEPAFDVDRELSIGRLMTGRDDSAAHLEETP